jgi:hypothetical protein
MSAGMSAERHILLYAARISRQSSFMWTMQCLPESETGPKDLNQF